MLERVRKSAAGTEFHDARPERECALSELGAQIERQITIVIAITQCFSALTQLVGWQEGIHPVKTE